MIDANERYAEICKEVFEQYLAPLEFTDYKAAIVTGKTVPYTTPFQQWNSEGKIQPRAPSKHEKAERKFLSYADDMFDAIKDDGLIYPTRIMMEKFERASGLDQFEQGVHRMIGNEEGGIFGNENHAVYMLEASHVLALAMIAEVLELWYKYPVLRVYLYKDVYMRSLREYHYTVVLGEAGGADRQLEKAGVAQLE